MYSHSIYPFHILTQLAHKNIYTYDNFVINTPYPRVNLLIVPLKHLIVTIIHL